MFDMIKHYPQILIIPFDMHMLPKIHTTPWKAYSHFEDKHFVFGLSWEPTTMDILEVWMVLSGMILSIIYNPL